MVNNNNGIYEWHTKRRRRKKSRLLNVNGGGLFRLFQDTLIHGNIHLLTMLLLKGQAQISGHTGDLLVTEFWHFLGHLEGPLLLHVGLGENQINLLKLAAGGLGIEEIPDGDTDEVDQGEEEVKTPFTLVGKDWREHDDGEVADPVGACRHGRRSRTRAERVDLGWVDPRQRQEGEGEEDDEKKETDSCSLAVLLSLMDVARGGRRCALDIIGAQASHRDYETETLAQKTDDEQLASTNLFDHEEGWDRAQSVDRGEDATQNEGESIAGTEIILEKQRRVVDGGIATGELLEELARAADHHPLELLRLAEREKRLPRALGRRRLLQVGFHQIEVVENLFILGIHVIQFPQDVARLIIETLGDEPAWRFRQHESSHRSDDGKDDLERNGEPPLGRRVDVRQTEIDPVGDKRADGNDGTFETHEEPPIMGARAFRLPHGDGGGVQTVADARDDTTDHELPETPVRAEGGG